LAAVTLPLEPDREGKSCFVIFPFREPFLEYYEVVYAPAIREAGLIPVKGNDLFAAGDVLGQIWRSLQEAAVILAELSLLSANVYYEIGLAHALRKPSVLVVQSLDLVPFDLQAGRCISYSVANPFWGQKLKTSITQALGETLREPLRSIPAAILLDSHAKRGEDESENLSEDARARLAFDVRLRQLQQGVDRLLLGADPRTRIGNSERAAATPRELKEVAAQLAKSGMPAAQIAQHLVDLGASELWARHTAEGLAGLHSEEK
jgi:hypothetical protein